MPDTIIFKEGGIHRWLFTSKKDKTKTVLQKKSNKLHSEYLKEHFKRATFTSNINKKNTEKIMPEPKVNLFQQSIVAVLGISPSMTNPIPQPVGNLFGMPRERSGRSVNNIKFKTNPLFGSNKERGIICPKTVATSSSPKTYPRRRHN